MSITTKLGALGAAAIALVMGLAACQTAGTVTSLFTDTGEETFTSWLSKPEGDGPFPAVVLMHGCSGTERGTTHQTVWRGLKRHSQLLNQNGYVTLIVDSFGPRRITDGCQTGGKYYPVQIGDAHAAFDHLASLPFVDGERIGAVGLSLGGGTALQLALKSSVLDRASRDRKTYAALVAYYPWCEPAWASSIDRPVLILIGADDDWTPSWRCATLHNIAEKATNTPVVDLKVYPDTHHSFDLPMRGPYLVEGMDGRTHTVAGNVEARWDSQERMLAFFAKYLGGSHSTVTGGKVDIAAHLGFGNFLRAAFALND